MFFNKSDISISKDIRTQLFACGGFVQNYPGQQIPLCSQVCKTVQTCLIAQPETWTTNHDPQNWSIAVYQCMTRQHLHTSGPANWFVDSPLLPVSTVSVSKSLKVYKMWYDVCFNVRNSVLTYNLGWKISFLTLWQHSPDQNPHYSYKIYIIFKFDKMWLTQ